MNDLLAERLCIALEQLVLELAEHNANRQAATPPAPLQAVAPAAPQPFAPIGWVCPVHGTQRVVPAGISARTGQPYAAFVVCGEQSCNMKPPKPALPQRALPVSQGGQMP